MYKRWDDYRHTKDDTIKTCIRGDTLNDISASDEMESDDDDVIDTFNALDRLIDLIDRGGFDSFGDGNSESSLLPKKRKMYKTSNTNIEMSVEEQKCFQQIMEDDILISAN